MKNDFVNWKPKKKPPRNDFRLSIELERSSAILKKSFLFVRHRNRFLNANKCHQSIFIIMVLWLIAHNFSQTNEPLNEKHWKQLREIWLKFRCFDEALSEFGARRQAMCAQCSRSRMRTLYYLTHKFPIKFCCRGKCVICRPLAQHSDQSFTMSNYWHFVVFIAN